MKKLCGLLMACLLVPVLFTLLAPAQQPGQHHVVVPEHFNDARLRAAHFRLINHVVSQTVLTPKTVFLLDNTACTYDQVPADSRVQLIEFAEDGQTITRIVFRKVGRVRP